MISSGTKRGLAAAAVSALALAGIPALASSASAAPADGSSFTLIGAGPVLNGGLVGGAVAISYPTGTTPTPSTQNLHLANTALTSDDPDTATQDIGGAGNTINSVTILPEGTFPDVAGDGKSTAVVTVTVKTSAVGGTAAYAIYEDADSTPGSAGPPVVPPTAGTPGVQAGDPRVQVSVVTAGSAASVDVTPASQTAPVGQASGNYTAAIADSAGRPTQLDAGQQVAVTAAGGATTFGGAAADNVLSPAELVSGSATFTATGTGPTGLRTITAAASGTGAGTTTAASGSDTATLDVVQAATLTTDDIDVVTGADSWDGFGDVDADATDPDNPIGVRVDQNSIRIDIASSDPANKGATVTLTVNGTDLTPGNTADGNGLTFGGKATTTLTTTLDANGKGSVTITPDAGTIQENDTFTLSGSSLPTLNFQFQRAQLSAVQAPADVYISGLKKSVDITVTAEDQFGFPIAGSQIDAQRTAGADIDATPQARKTTDAKGQATFTFTDTSAVAGQNSTVTFRGYDDQFDATPGPSDTTTIRYTSDGLGADYTLALDGVNTAGSTYAPSDVSVRPLTDTVANDDSAPKGDEVANLTIVGGEAGAPVTVSVDGGALIEQGSDEDLSDGAASATGVVGDSFSVVGTKSGVVTVTVASAGRTKTAQLTVQAQTSTSTARNVTVSGPAVATAGHIATFTAVVTDAFGNGIAGIPAGALNVQVTGPAALQDTGALTGADGSVALNVRLQDDASGTVTIKVTGVGGAQFGAAANRETAGSTTDDAMGLTASSNVATASLTAVNPAPPVTAKKSIALKLNGKGNGAKADKLTANANKNGHGLTAVLYRGGKKVASHKLNGSGNYTFKIADKNGAKSTKYIVKVAGTTKTKKDSAVRSVK